MANVYSIAYTVLGVAVAHCCLLIWTAITLPGPVERARRRIETRSLSSFFIGLVCCVVTIGLVGGFCLVRGKLVPHVDDLLENLSNRLEFSRWYNDAWMLTNLLVWPLLLPVLAGFAIGGAAVARMFGNRARTMMRDDRPLLGLTYGAACTSVSYFMPLIGWFVFLPIVGLISIGAGICGMLGRGVAAETEARTSPARRPEPVLTNR